MIITKLLVGVAVTGVVIGSGIAVTNHYKNYQHKQALETRAAELQQEAAVAKAEDAAKVVTAVNKALSAENETLQAECEKGLYAYSKLTPYQKTTVAAPVCD